MRRRHGEGSSHPCDLLVLGAARTMNQPWELSVGAPSGGLGAIDRRGARRSTHTERGRLYNLRVYAHH